MHNNPECYNVLIVGWYVFFTDYRALVLPGILRGKFKEIILCLLQR